MEVVVEAAEEEITDFLVVEVEMEVGVVIEEEVEVEDAADVAEQLINSLINGKIIKI